MKRFIVRFSVIALLLFSTSVFAAVPNPPLYNERTSEYLNNFPAINGVSITDNNATHPRCRAIWIGTTQSLDLSFDGSTWVLFKAATAGTYLPFQVVGVRKTAGSAAPDAGDVVFLY